MTKALFAEKIDELEAQTTAAAAAVEAQRTSKREATAARKVAKAAKTAFKGTQQSVAAGQAKKPAPGKAPSRAAAERNLIGKID